MAAQKPVVSKKPVVLLHYSGDFADFTGILRPGQSTFIPPRLGPQKTRYKPFKVWLNTPQLALYFRPYRGENPNLELREIPLCMAETSSFESHCYCCKMIRVRKVDIRMCHDQLSGTRIQRNSEETVNLITHRP